MKHTWLIWFLIVGVVVTILVALNYEGRQQTVPLSEIFSEEETRAVEYEFAETDTDLPHPVNMAVTRQPMTDIAGPPRPTAPASGGQAGQPRILPGQGQATAAARSKTPAASPHPAAALPPTSPVRPSAQVPAKSSASSSPSIAVSAPVARPASPQAVHLGKKTFTIQVASFKDKDRAEKALTQIHQKGYASAYIGSKSREGGGFWYRVYVGQFNARQEAAELLAKIQQDYKDSFILLVPNP